MKEEVIVIENLTKSYGNGKGIFLVNLSVKKGEVFGFLGPNGAGKTTSIRHLMGFIRPDSGSVSILGMDCFKDAKKIQSNLGYLAGEIAFLEDLSGRQLIEFIASMRNIKVNTDKKRIEELMERFELDPRNKIRKMSKGMKQKVGIICAFMHDPDIIILDEPTSGLDPLMQNRFVDLVLEEKERGKTIFMSSHIFEEIEKTCDRTAMIKDGKIIAIEDMKEFRRKKGKTIQLVFQNEADIALFESKGYPILAKEKNTISTKIEGDVMTFLKEVVNYQILDMETKAQSLEEIFLHYYGGK